MQERFTKTDGSFDTSRKTPEQLANTLFGLTKLHNMVTRAMEDDDTLSARVAELTAVDLRVKLTAAGYTVGKPPGSSKPYYKDGGKWAVHVAMKPADDAEAALDGSPRAHAGDAAEAAGADAVASFGVAG